MNPIQVMSTTITRAPRHIHIARPGILTALSGHNTYRCQSSYQNVGTRSRKVSSTTIPSQISTGSEDIADEPDLPPHSLMPTGMLLRASLVSTISSKPILLNPALKVLTYLTQTRIALFSVSKNPVLHAILKRTFYNHFCAGENGAEVTRTIENLKNIGFKGVILTYAREIVVDANLNEKGKGTLDAESGKTDMKEAHSPDIDSWKDGVLLTVKLLGKDDFLALKLTGAGASVMSALSTTKTVPRQMSEALEEICTQALARNVRILVDAEQQSVQSGIDAVAIDLMRKHNKPHQTATVYNTYQAYLKSCPETLRRHMQTASAENFSLGVKLVRGAYMASEPRQLIHDTKADTDRTYDNIATGLLEQTYDPFLPSVHHHNGTKPASSSDAFPAVSLFLATHNKPSALHAHETHKTRLLSNTTTTTGLPTVHTLQYGQLLGMADQVSCALLQLGQREKKKQQQHSLTSSSTKNDTPPTAAAGAAAVIPEVYKCLSWGPLEDCLSYLLRRARENKDAVGRSRDEHEAVWAEIRRRVRAKFAM